MTHMPGIPIRFDEPDLWTRATGVCCRSCSSPEVRYRTHESSCGGYEDDEFNCTSCGHSWWVDGIDS
jgi:DNA-directed RNA polymerase subunit M/transcription elongation factor TFIIS